MQRKGGMKKISIFMIFFFAVCTTGILPQEASISVGIIDFQSKDNAVSPSGEAVSALTSHLGKYKFINLVERSKIGSIMKEIELSQTGVLDENEAIKIGKISGVRVLIDGYVSGKGAYARAIYAETGKIIAVSAAADFRIMAKELARGIEVYLAKENIRNLRNESSDITTEFWAEVSGRKCGAGTEVKAQVGNTVSFHFKTDTDGYLTIIDIQPSGDIVLLYPNDFAPNNAVKAGVEYSIPSNDDTFDLTFTEPAGQDTLVAFFSKRKVDWLDKEKLSGDGFKTVLDGEKISAARSVAIQSRQLKKNEWESLVLTINVEK